jgi:predicted dehydrogenase
MTYLFGRVGQIQGTRTKVSALEADIDDLYAAVVRFESGVQGSLVVEVISRPGIRRARIVGEEGTLIWDFGERRVLEWSRGRGEWVEHPDPPPVQGPGGAWVAENMYIEEMRGFLRGISEGREHYPFSLEEDQQLLGSLAALERASDDGHRVDLS